MDIITGTKEFWLDMPSAVAIGKFDGVHIGHKKLLAEILEQKKNGLKACVFTFDPAPVVFFGVSDGKELTTKEEKRELFEKMGVDILVEYPMDRDTAKMSPEDFIEKVLAERFRARFVAAGTDVSFGYKGAGNADLLQAKAEKYGYEVKLIDKICVENREVSSTFVRETVEEGNVELTAKLLGEPYMVRGIVVHGKKLGRTLGFPTVNLVPPQSKLMPRSGVYRSVIIVEGKEYKGISNVGYKPTVSDDKNICGVETYIYDFEDDVYGKEIKVAFCEFCRPEKKFDSIEELKEQIRQDMLANW